MHFETAGYSDIESWVPEPRNFEQQMIRRWGATAGDVSVFKTVNCNPQFGDVFMNALDSNLYFNILHMHNIPSRVQNLANLYPTITRCFHNLIWSGMFDCTSEVVMDTVSSETGRI